MEELYKTDSEENFHRGKIREIYQTDDEDHLMIISTDRIDLNGDVFPNSVTGKGIFVNRITNKWLDILNVPNHRISMGEIPKNDLRELIDLENEIQDRVLVAKKVDPVGIRVVIMSHLNGIAWDEYFDKGTICGVEFQKGLNHKDKIPSGPIAIPFMETNVGVLEMIDPDQACNLIKDKWDKILQMSFEVYRKATKVLNKKGVILAHTELNFGFLEDEPILIGDILTPDSTCYWFENSMEPENKSYQGFDRQILEEWYYNLESSEKHKGLPKIPKSISEKIIDKYKDLLLCLNNK